MNSQYTSDKALQRPENEVDRKPFRLLKWFYAKFNQKYETSKSGRDRHMK